MKSTISFSATAVSMFSVEAEGDMETLPDNIYFILVGPTEPGNIGAAARAIKNMGFRKLELVNPIPYLTDEAKSRACGAKDVLERAAVHLTLREAVAEKMLVVGTTRRLGSRRGLLLTIREGANRIGRVGAKNAVAILFGNEHNGLTNREIDECAFLITIPSARSFPSLNLAQSVMLVAYELGQPALKPAPLTSEWPELIQNRELQKLYQELPDILRLLKFGQKGDQKLAADILRNLKRLFGRSGLTPWELNMLLGLCRRVGQRLKK
jgi:TrmH family RNA methyltransferase